MPANRLDRPRRPDDEQAEPGPRASAHRLAGTRSRRRAWLSAALVLAVLVGAVALAMTFGRPAAQLTTAAPTPGPAGGGAASKGIELTPAPASAQPSASGSKAPASPTHAAAAKPPTLLSGWPSARNTGVPAGQKLHSCATRITVGKTYDSCVFNGDVDIFANNVRITRSLIKGQVGAGAGSQQRGLVISDSTIACGCPADQQHAPASVSESNYTLIRVNLYGSGHGVVVNSNVTIQDSYIHGLGANTDAHKDGVYSAGGSNVVLRHNNIECNDGPAAGCTAAIGLLTDFANVSNYTIDGNLLNTIGAYCFYGSGGPSKSYSSDHIVFTNNHFGRLDNAKCGSYGPVTYFDANSAGNVWRGNVWDGSGGAVAAEY